MRTISVDNQILFELTMRHGDLYILGTEGFEGDAHRKAILGIEKQLYSRAATTETFDNLAKLTQLRTSTVKKVFQENQISFGIFLKRSIDLAVIDYELALHLACIHVRNNMSEEESLEIEKTLSVILKKIITLINELICHPSTKPTEKIFLRHLIPNLDFYSFMVRTSNLNKLDNFYATENPSVFTSIQQQAEKFLQLLNQSESIIDHPMLALRYRMTPEGMHELSTYQQPAKSFFNHLMHEHASLFLSKRPYRDVLVCGEAEMILHQNQSHSEFLFNLYQDISMNEKLDEHLAMLENHRVQLNPESPTMIDYDYSRARAAIYLKKFLQSPKKSNSNEMNYPEKALHEIEHSMHCLERLMATRKLTEILIEMCMMVRLCHSYLDTIASFSFGFTIDSNIVKSIDKVVARHNKLVPMITHTQNQCRSFSIYAHKKGEFTEICGVTEFFNPKIQVQKFINVTRSLTNQATLVSSSHPIFNTYKVCATAIGDASRAFTSELKTSALRAWKQAFTTLESYARNLLAKPQEPLAEFETYYFLSRAITEGLMCPQLVNDKLVGKILRERSKTVFNYIQSALQLINNITLSQLSRNALILLKLYELDFRNFYCTLQECVNKKSITLFDLHLLLQDYFHLTTKPNVDIRQTAAQLMPQIHSAVFAGKDVVLLEVLWQSIGLSLKLPIQKLLEKLHPHSIQLSKIPYTTAEKITQSLTQLYYEDVLSSRDLVIKFLAHCCFMQTSKSPMAAIMLLYAQQELASFPETWQEVQRSAYAVGAIRIHQQTSLWMGNRSYLLKVKSAAEDDGYASAEDEQPIDYAIQFRLLGVPVGANPNLNIVANAIIQHNKQLFQRHLKASFESLYSSVQLHLVSSIDLLNQEVKEFMQLSNESPRHQLVHALKQVLIQACSLHAQFKQRRQIDVAENLWATLQNELNDWFENGRKVSTLNLNDGQPIDSQNLRRVHSRM